MPEHFKAFFVVKGLCTWRVMEGMLLFNLFSDFGSVIIVHRT